MSDREQFSLDAQTSEEMIRILIKEMEFLQVMLKRVEKRVEKYPEEFSSKSEVDDLREKFKDIRKAVYSFKQQKKEAEDLQRGREMEQQSQIETLQSQNKKLDQRLERVKIFLGIIVALIVIGTAASKLINEL